MNYITVPESGMKLSDGAIVMIARYPNSKWILHYGWYTYQNQQSLGWYFTSLSDSSVIPVNDDDLRSLTAISGQSQCNCNCPPPMSPQPPMPPMPPMPPRIKEELDRAFITVDTIAERNNLNRELVPQGKIVRVNYTESGAKYYIWDQVSMSWEDITFDHKDYITKSEADEKYSAKSEVSESLTQISEEIGQVSDKVENLHQVVWENLT